jgi:thiol-disulfide isomerase/thioredoxin
VSTFGSIGKRVARGLLDGVARQVARDGLFEQPGERPRQAPLAGVSPSQLAAPAAAAAPAASPDSSTDTGARRALATLVDIDGVRSALAAPGAVLVVNHWATWCIPCIEEFPHLRALQARVGAKARFVGVSWDLFDPRGDEDDIREHVENFGTGQSLGWPTMVLGESVTAPDFFSAFGIEFQQIPQTWIVGPGGEVLRRIDGVIGADDLDDLVADIERAVGA